MDKYCKMTKFYKEPKGNYNILSTVLFLTPYGYKSSLMYIDGLKANLQDFYLHFDNTFYYRIYYDKSVVEEIHDDQDLNSLTKECKSLFDKLKTAPRVQLIMYECPKFKKNKNYHKGLFGTILRFSALFNEKNIKVVVSSDTEKMAVFDIKVAYEYLKLNDADVAWRTGKRKFLSQLDDRIIHDDWIFAGNFISKVKFNSNILEQFFKDMDDSKSKLSKYMQKVRDFLKKNKDNIYDKILDNENNYIYGYDEAFLNFYLKPEFQKNNNSALIIEFPRFTMIFNSHFKENNKFKDFTEIEKLNINEFYKLLIGESFKLQDEPIQNYYTINKLIYPIKINIIRLFEMNFLKNYNNIIENATKYKLSESILKNIKIVHHKLLTKNTFIKKYKYKYKKWY
jgi:hypothetical protein